MKFALVLLPPDRAEALREELKEAGFVPIRTACLFCGGPSNGDFCSDQCERDSERMQLAEEEGDRICHEILERRTTR